MRLLFALVFALGCQTQSPALEKDRPAAEQTAAPAPAPVATANAAAATDEEGPCAADADCALTRVPKGGCCETLCQGRPVTKARAQELAKAEPMCMKQGTTCPIPLCRPPREQRVAACVAGKCGVRRLDLDER